MRRRRGRPLFEVIRDQQRGTTRFTTPQTPFSPTSQRGPLPAVDGGSAESEETPRTLRIPTGYLVVAGGVWIISVVAAFSIGFSRGGSAALEEARQERLSASPLLNIGDPEIDDSLTQGGRSEITQRNADDGLRQTSPNRTSQPEPTDDTRVAGLNYIVVERFPSEEAFSVAKFLMARGIDVMVLPDKDQRLRRVVTRKGFEGWRSNAEAQALEEELLRLGRLWKSQGGSKDFSQLLPQKYEG